MPRLTQQEAEWLTRKRRIDPALDAAGWRRARGRPGAGAWRTEEEPTANGPADYALWLDGEVVAIVEAKKVGTATQGVLTQAERYARGLRGSPHNHGGLRCPFLYATNGALVYFRDVRHAHNRSRQVARFHTPGALRELLAHDADAAYSRLLATPHDHPRLRPYQRDANRAVEQALAERKRRLLVAMATGTGKTVTFVNEAYRLMREGVARRVLFLVDRRALAAQAVRAFAAFEAEPGQKFDQIYEVYSSRFHAADLDDGERFDPRVLPTAYLTHPEPGRDFVYVCTVQRMAAHVLGRQALVDAGGGDSQEADEADRLDIPIHAFDLVIADECHRGYTSAELSVWRSTIDHFDAVKVGLTATPAAHTTAYFTDPAYEYRFEQAVRDGYLVDYDVVKVRSEVRVHGVFLREGEHVEVVDPDTGLARLDTLEDERAFTTSELESAVTAPASNRLILEALRAHAEAHEERYGRFPKTLIFAANDVPHTSHADQLVELARDVFGRGDAFVAKITGRVDRPLQRIREFRNRPVDPGIAVTVDLLSTGVDIPDLECIIFLRAVKSRILFEQILGRGTRRGERHPDKSHFTVFDCFDGTLLEYFRKSTGMTAEAPDRPTRTIAEIVDDIWANRDREYNVGCLVKRLQRVDKEMAGEARPLFAAFVPDGDLAGYARGLRERLRTDFVGTMRVLRDPALLALLANYPRPPRTFLRAPEYPDTVSSAWLVRDGTGQEYKPEDYLTAFAGFVRDAQAEVAAIRILLDRPQEWSAGALTELRQQLATSRFRFTEETLQRAHELRYHKALVDVISMVQRAADEEAPLLTAAERVARAFARVTQGLRFDPEQARWLERVRQVMCANLSIDRGDFDDQAALADAGGWGAARRAFGEPPLDELLGRLNAAVAA